MSLFSSWNLPAGRSIHFGFSEHQLLLAIRDVLQNFGRTSNDIIGKIIDVHSYKGKAFLVRMKTKSSPTHFSS